MILILIILTSYSAVLRIIIMMVIMMVIVMVVEIAKMTLVMI